MSHNEPIAIVGMACVYPDARSPDELWENTLGCRSAFRALPPERIRPEDYVARDRGAVDRTYLSQAAVIEGYTFDRIGFRVNGRSYRSADLAHWLALDVAAQALAAAGFPGGEGLPRSETGVLVGNSLTGEFARANQMRLRWPYVRRIVEAALCDDGWSPARRRAFLAGVEARYKAPFPPIGEETLAGGLSNTIAGRICNHFHLQGGGYTVDGACASSLLAVAHACAALDAGDLAAALAGGVDLSLDPFELVGFAKAGALAGDEMRVYDTRANGFWPGEGCGMIVLMRLSDARARGCRVDGVIRGWGISSDGRGGITRPEVGGQRLALGRAYRRAGFGIESVSYFEGHGTGTVVGDDAELRALASALDDAGGEPSQPPPAVSSIKANIGHTKAAAGIAGLIRATCAVRDQMIPPHVGCERPRPELGGESARLRLLPEAECWPANRPLRAGVSAMGFGGINTHVVVEGIAERRRGRLDPRQRELIGSAQDAELLLVAAESSDGLRRKIERLAAFGGRLARAQLADLAAVLSREHAMGAMRAALVASRPDELVDRLEVLRGWLAEGVSRRLDLRAGVFLGGDAGEPGPRIGLLFPGQGCPVLGDGGALARRFELVRSIFQDVGLPGRVDASSTEFAQPAIVAATLAGLHALGQLGIEGAVAVGHSLGELTALHWAGALDAGALLRIAVARGQAMASAPGPAGAMASLAARPSEVEALLGREPVVIAGYNSPVQTVVSGPADAVERVSARARDSGIATTRLRVGHAFHSPLMSGAAQALARALVRESFRPLRRPVSSTVDGVILPAGGDFRALLRRQLTAPIRFVEALTAAGPVDLWIEVGPGHMVGRLVSEMEPATPLASIDAGGPSWVGMLHAAGAAFALGAVAKPDALCDGRLVRPIDLDWQPRFFVNPCELAPEPEARGGPEAGEVPSTVDPNDTAVNENEPDATPGGLIRALLARRTELPPNAIDDRHRLIGDLHLNSIAVGELVAEAARRLGMTPPLAATDYADATVGEIIRALEQLRETGVLAAAVDDGRPPRGVDSWVRAFALEWVEQPPNPRRRRVGGGSGRCEIIASGDHRFLAAVREGFEDADVADVVVCLPPDPDDRQIALLLAGARAVLMRRDPSRFVLIQHGGGAASWARTLHLEAPGSTVCVVDVPEDRPEAAGWAVVEAGAATGFVEARYDGAGRRFEPILRHWPLARPGGGTFPSLGRGDVLLVSGGGKGIAAECALHLARRHGAKLALLGRSSHADAELRANLRRMAEEGVESDYIAADVTDAAAVGRAVHEFRHRLGEITAILHGAGANVPKLLSSLDEESCLRTLAPKVLGARHLIEAVPIDNLRLFLAFGSIIARTGLRGEADYALANEWLARLTERLQRERPGCRCLLLEWSVWSGVGMGQRLGRVDTLARQGIAAITPEEGIDILQRLLSGPTPGPSVVVTGRLGPTPTLRVEQPELPLRRFLERPRIYYPGVELIVEADLSSDADPYLSDHVLGGDPVFPAVMGLEAIAQAAMALAGSDRPPDFEDVAFSRPILVPASGRVMIQVAALARESGTVEVVVRSGATGFQVDHFHAVCRFEDRPEAGAAAMGGAIFRTDPGRVPLDVDRELYGGLLFQGGRFRRLRGYRRLGAWECLADIASAPDGEGGRWFGPYLPPGLVLGDLAARDAAVHAIQACIPYAALVPVGVDRVSFSVPGWTGRRLARAHQRSGIDGTFIYDLEILDEDGRILERWEGLRLRTVQGRVFRGPWAVPLLGPCLERRLRDLIPGPEIEVAVEQAGREDGECGHRAGRTRAVARLLGPAARLRSRPDGKPEICCGHAPGRSVSLSHAGPLTFAVVGSGPLGCDIEPISTRSPSLWLDLLGFEPFNLARHLARDTDEDDNAVATRLWTTIEALKKAGAPVQGPLVLFDVERDGWVVFKTGSMMVATFVAAVADPGQRFAIAVAARGVCHDHK
jgi:enediyne polyketide synthase